jgi:uncharacterized delta-60 repeat protein
MTRRIRWAFALALVAVALPASAWAAAGDLDPSFSGDGIFRAQLSSKGSNANAVAVQADGKIVTAGFAGDFSEGTFALMRLNSDGTFDASFGGTGKITTRFSAGVDFARGVAIQSDGKIVTVGGSDLNGHGRFAIARYNINGTLDTTFSSDGKRTVNLTAGDDWATAVAIDSAGRIVVVGHASGEYGVARLNPDGSLDASFSHDGIARTLFGRPDGAETVALSSIGEIVAAGGGYGDMGIVVYHSNGRLDRGFSGDGRRRISFGAGNSAAEGVLVQANGRILVAGSTDNGRENHFALARLEPGGRLDRAFGGDGRVTTNFAGLNELAFGITREPDGKIVAAGLGGRRQGFAIARYHRDGTLDKTFGGDGKVVKDASGSGVRSGANAVTIDSLGRILAAGSVNGNPTRTAVLRYLN